MANLKIKKIVPTSLAKIMAIYSFILMVLAAIIDLILKIATGNSSFVGSNTWGAWIVYMIISLILAPIFGYIGGLISAWIINLALRIGKDLELEVE